MIKVAYISFSDDGTAWYRSQGVFPFIHHAKAVFHDISHLSYGSWSAIAGYDVLIMSRPFNDQHVSIIQQAQWMGLRVIIDHDDLVTDVPSHNPAHGLYKQNNRFVLQAIRMADEIWCTTEFIKQQWLKYNKNIHVVPNAHNDYIYPKAKTFDKLSKTMLYRGGNTHRLDLLQITPQLIDIAKRNSDWKFIFMGCDDNHEFIRSADQCENILVTNRVPIVQYFNYINSLSPAIMIAPLEGNPLNRAKSNISYLEGSAAGAAFFGNKLLDEFNLTNILPLTLLDKSISENHLSTLKEYQERSWAYISENLLLSKINQLRLNRILA